MVKKETTQLGIMQFITNKLYDLSGNRWSVAYAGDKSGYMFRALENDTDVCIVGLDCFIQTKDLHKFIYWQIRYAMGTVDTGVTYNKMLKDIEKCTKEIEMFREFPLPQKEVYLKNSSFWNLFCVEG